MMSMSNIFKLTLVAGAGSAGYWLGRNQNENEERWMGGFSLLSGLPTGLRASAATLLRDSTRHPPVTVGEGNIPQPVDSRPDAAVLVKTGFPHVNTIRNYGDFVVSYDMRNRVPNWVFEHLTKDTAKRNKDVDRSDMHFFEDASIHPYFRSRNTDYAQSGYDRGHMAAAGNHKSTYDTCKKTFVLTNIAPQVGEGFNRHAWNRLEKKVRKLLKYYKDVFVFTGPLYLPRVESDGKSYVKYEVIGKNSVAVPTHFFKVILVITKSSKYYLKAFVMPNKPISDDVPISSFEVPIESVERASGLLFFHQIPVEKDSNIFDLLKDKD